MASRKLSPRKKMVKTAPKTSVGARVYPFTSIVGQEEMRLALLLSLVEPAIGGVLVMGHRGTGKSTAVRALAELLPPLTRAARCAFNCDPDNTDELCDDCRATLTAQGKLTRERTRVPVVELPLNATEDRVAGSINLERAITEGRKVFEPGLLARAHRGFLYIDEVNLLEDHLVDLLLDVAATGRNRVEREGISEEHAARFVLVGSGNPEEGELRPQLLDRFGLCAEVTTPASADERAEVVTRRERFDRDPSAFVAAAEKDQTNLRRKIVRARRAVADVRVPHALVRSIAELCARLNVAGHRGELTIARAARALAAFEGRKVATQRDARRVAALALRHRLRRDPFEHTGGGGQIEQLAEEIFNASGSTSTTQATTCDAEAAVATKKDTERETDKTSALSFDNNLARVPDEDAARASDSPSSHLHQPDAPRASRESRAHDLPAPPAEQGASFDPQSASRVARRGVAPSSTSRSSRGHAKLSQRSARGRFVGKATTDATSRSLAFDATLRVVADRLTRSEDGSQTRDGNGLRRSESGSRFSLQSRESFESQCDSKLSVTADDLRFKMFARKSGTLFIFAVDASGSMAVNRIRQAKGALTQLLRRSYVNRDRVALVSFRESRAEILLQPTRSTALARRLLDALHVGGATPLAAGLARAHEIATRARRSGSDQIMLLVFTDGRANVSLAGLACEGDARSHLRNEIELIGAALRRCGVESLVVDTRARFTGDEEGRSLARALGGGYTRLPVAQS
jgi:magnesium chelatase ATPase subunit I